jgi:membrane fusion protein, multidrug efflux system
MEPTPINPRKRSPALYVVGLLLLMAAAGTVYYFVYDRYIQVAAARSAMEEDVRQGPRVEVVTVAAGPKTRDVVLLGDAKPYASTTLFAKVSGYIKHIAVDKGDTVRAGEVLAEIQSAEIDSQYSSAAADLVFKQRQAERARKLLRSGDVAAQAADQAEAALRMAEETVNNLATMRSYELIRAPFDGVVTGRFADPGALAQSATTNQASSLPLLTISDNTRLRVGVYVEQRDAALVHLGDAADVSDATNPDRRVSAKISRTAGMLDPRTRTLYVEIDVDNGAGFLVAGSFANVALHLPIPSLPQIPVSALLIRNGDALVASVAADGAIRLRPVKVASTDGITINVAEGVAPGDRLAIHLPDELADGAHIRPVLASR